MPKYLIPAIVLSNLSFWFFLSFGIYFWTQNRAEKIDADNLYLSMAESAQACQQAGSTTENECLKLRESRLEFDRAVERSGHYSSLTRLFLSFALLLPGLTWGWYFLTKTIFH